MQYGRLFSPDADLYGDDRFRLSDRNLAVQCLVCGILFGQCHLPGIERLYDSCPYNRAAIPPYS